MKTGPTIFKSCSIYWLLHKALPSTASVFDAMIEMVTRVSIMVDFHEFHVLSSTCVSISFTLLLNIFDFATLSCDDNSVEQKFFTLKHKFIDVVIV